MASTASSQIMAGSQGNVEKQTKPLLDGTEEEKYGTDSKVAPSYANYNNSNVSKEGSLHRLYVGLSIFCIFGLMTLCVYFYNVNKTNPIIQSVISIVWCIRILIRLVALYVNQRWYFQKKSKFRKMKSELFKMKQFGKISAIWIILIVIGYILLISVPFIESLCGDMHGFESRNYLIGGIAEFVVSLFTIWAFNICLYWYCDHHIQRINAFVFEIGNRKVYRSSITNNNTRFVEISASNIIQINASNTCIEQEINYTKQLWEKWVSYSFITDAIYLLFIVSIWLFMNMDNFENNIVVINIFCENNIAPQIINIFYFQFLGFIGLLYGIVRMNNMAKSKILEKTVKELGCKYDKYNDNQVLNCVQQQIIFQSFYTKLKEFPVGFEILQTKVYWIHFYMLLLFVIVLWLTVMLRLNV